MPVKKKLSLDEASLSRLREFQELTGTSRDEAVNLLLKMLFDIRSEPESARKRGKKAKKAKKTKITVHLEERLADLQAPSAALSAALRAIAPVLRRIGSEGAGGSPPEVRETPPGVAGELIPAVRREIDALIARLIALRGLLRADGEAPPGPEEEAVLVRELMYLLAAELNRVKGDPERVSAYRRIVPPEDVGYVTSLMTALYSDDRLKRWILTTDYRGEGDGR